MTLYEFCCPTCGARREAFVMHVQRDDPAGATPQCADGQLMQRVISVPAIRGETVSKS
jgi:putative FmdB family regulatory protein